MKTPNLFSFATSELSQDAMLAWLMKWADDDLMPIDEELCLLGKNMLSLLSGMSANEIHKVNVGRQKEHIDVWAEINDDTFLILEDKTHTGIHSNQLARYKEFVENHSGKKYTDFVYVYVKTGNEQLSRKRAIEKQGYTVVYRQQLLEVLTRYKGTNHIVIDFRRHLQAIEDRTCSFANIPVTEWDWYCWQGFYMTLENHKQDSGWDYVANPSGGFLGFWWHFRTLEDITIHLQFEEKKLCVKMECKGNVITSEMRDAFYTKLRNEAQKKGLPVRKPARFGSGRHITIGVVDETYLWDTTTLNMDTLLVKLQSIEELIDACLK